MTIRDVMEIVEGTVLTGEDKLDSPVDTACGSDLMSDVLLDDSDDILLLTSLASDQVIRTANIIGAMGVVVHNGKPLPEAMCQAAKNFGIPLVSTPLAKYQSCVRIHEFLSRQ